MCVRVANKGGQVGVAVQRLCVLHKPRAHHVACGRHSVAQHKLHGLHHHGIPAERRPAVLLHHHKRVHVHTLWKLPKRAAQWLPAHHHQRLVCGRAQHNSQCNRLFGQRCKAQHAQFLDVTLVVLDMVQSIHHRIRRALPNNNKLHLHHHVVLVCCHDHIAHPHINLAAASTRSCHQCSHVGAHLLDARAVLVHQAL